MKTMTKLNRKNVWPDPDEWVVPEFWPKGKEDAEGYRDYLRENCDAHLPVGCTYETVEDIDGNGNATGNWTVVVKGSSCKDAENADCDWVYEGEIFRHKQK